MLYSDSLISAGLAEAHGKGERALFALRNMIATGELHPGEHLRQDQLAQRIGTTRVPIREAFKTLVAEGLLIHRQNHGHFVTKLNSHELQQICWLRDVLEDELARTARWPDEAVVKHLRGLNDEIRALGPQASVHEITKIDFLLHLETWRLSNREVLMAEMIRVWRMIGPYRAAMGYTPQMIEEQVLQGHDRIIEALESHDRRAYRRSIAGHLKLAHRVVDFLRENEEAADGDRPPSAS